MRALILLAILLTLPLASGQADVEILAVDVPDRTMAAKPFNASVELRNHGAAREVYLFGALYAGDEASPCGAATDARFKGFTQLVIEAVHLPAGGTVAYPPQGERWQHRYDADDVGPGPQLDEWCVFVGETAQSAQLDWLAFNDVPLSTRQTNGAPQGSFTVSPESPRVAQDVGFLATGSDPEDDPVRFRWDFGHANASGRATAVGPIAFHPFYPEGTYTVTLFVTDGLDETAITRDITVRSEAAPAPTASVAAQQPAAETPALGPAALFAIAALVALRKRM